MRRLRKLAAAAAPLMLAATALTVTTATQANAAASACQHPSWSNKSTGTGHAKNLNAAVHTGPNAGCSIIAYVGANFEMQYDCWFVNSSGNRWTHVKVPSAAISGWVWNDNLDDGGSVASSSKC